VQGVQQCLDKFIVFAPPLCHEAPTTRPAEIVSGDPLHLIAEAAPAGGVRPPGR
jgi:hypothetical protein